MVAAAGVAIVLFVSPGSHAAPVLAAQAAARQDRPAGPLRVLSVTPAAGATGVNGAAPIRVRFSAPLAADTPMPALWPHVAGSWQVEGDTAVFTCPWLPRAEGTPVSPGEVHFVPGRPPAGTSGSDRSRWPVAVKMALATADATATSGVSPAAAGAMSVRSTSTTSMPGTSLNRGTPSANA
jgi:hypothetical protein